MSASVPSQLISAPKLQWLLFCHFAVIAPHLERIPLWATVISILTAIWGYQATTRKWPYPSRIILITLTAISIAGVFFSYRNIFGRDEGVTLLIIMLSLKLLESKTERDFYLIIFMGYFLVITNFLYTQTILIALYMLAVSICLTSALMMLTRRDAGRYLKRHLKLSGLLMLQAAPIMIILFLLFPRLPSPLWNVPESKPQGITGLADSMQPGSLSQLSRSDAIAFRVAFDGNIPTPGQLYWRGPVLWNYDGINWTKRLKPEQRPETGPVVPVAGSFQYTTTIEPHLKNWLLALDMPTTYPEEAYLNPDFSLVISKKIKERYQYSATSYTQYRMSYTLSAQDRTLATRLPDTTNPRSRQWAQEIQAQATSDEDKINTVLRHFREQPYFYTLSPALLGRNAIDDFMFNTREGFCEHYAGAFVYMMRLMDVPARVVLGYQGGEYNEIGDYLLVRQSDAHAWTEVWLEGRGWTRFDPTSAVSPERINAGIDAALPERESTEGLRRSRDPVFRSVLFYWDSLNYRWQSWVLAYDSRKRLQLLQQLGFDPLDWKDLAMVFAGSLAIALGLIAFWINFGKRIPRTDNISKLYERFCKRLARCGIRRQAHEGPLDFSQRVIDKMPEAQQEVTIITQLYVQLRYGRNPPAGLYDQLRKRIHRFRPPPPQHVN